MSATITWIRHGTCADGFHRPEAHARPRSLLTRLGARQAERAAQTLRKSGLTSGVIASSTLLRARSTARIVSELTGLTLSPADSTFDEWRAPTCVLGRSPAQYPDAYVEWRSRRTTDPKSALPGGESLVEFHGRARRAMAAAELLAEAGAPVVVVSHRLLIGAVAAISAGTDDPVAVFNHARHFELRPAEAWTHEKRGTPYAPA
ncbi:histidine phosphatase family protein [Promicromonospora sp. NPDC052451]|uniref:histidine phosphatase family protein n=1 Tax=Promicromonospora sp. NPDC052451 TaxID=3364407 RepID=UPI0037C7D000